MSLPASKAALLPWRKTSFSASITLCFFFGVVTLPAFYPTVLELMISLIRLSFQNDTTGQFQSSPAYVFTLVTTLGALEPIPEQVRLYRTVQDSRGGIIFSFEVQPLCVTVLNSFYTVSYHGANINQLIITQPVHNQLFFRVGKRSQ